MLSSHIDMPPAVNRGAAQLVKGSQRVETYTITITPDDGSGAQTTVRVVVDAGETRLTELVFRPADGTSISEDQLSAVDLGMLLRAIQPEAGAAARPTDGADDGAAPVGRPAERPPHGRARPGNAAAKAAKSAPAKSAPARAGRAKTTARRAQPSAGAAAVQTPEPRVYRRMPDDLAEQFAAAGSVNGLAAHYGVPRYTAQGWVNRLRKQDQS